MKLLVPTSWRRAGRRSTPSVPAVWRGNGRSRRPARDASRQFKDKRWGIVCNIGRCGKLCGETFYYQADAIARLKANWGVSRIGVAGRYRVVKLTLTWQD